MKKQIYYRRCMFGFFFLHIGLFAQQDTMHQIIPQEQSDSSVNLNVPKLKPKTVKLFPRKKVTSENAPIVCQENPQAAFKPVTTTPAPKIATKLEDELHASLQDFHRRVEKKTTVSNIFDQAINELTVQQVQKKTQQPFATDPITKQEASQPIFSPKIEMEKDESQELKKLLDDEVSIISQPMVTRREFIESRNYCPDYVETAVTGCDAKCDTKTSASNKRIYLGHAHNYAVIEKEGEKRFAIPNSITASFALNALDGCGRTVSLAKLLFPTPGQSATGAELAQQSFTIGDIFLLSRLSATEVNDDPDMGILFLEPMGPGEFADPPTDSIQAKFGNRRQQQYAGLLAPVQVKLTADFWEFAAQTGLIYRFGFTDEPSIACAIGLIIPIVSRFNDLCIDFEGGKLFDRTEFAAKDATVREDSIRNFFNDFSDLEDFFIRAVLEPKGIIFNKRQNLIGFGDIQLFGLVDLAPLLCQLDGFQVGLTLTFPTSPKPKGNTLFEIALDDGAFEIDLFTNVIFNGNNWINPTFYIAGNFSIAQSVRMRSSQLVSHTAVNVGAADYLANDQNRVTNIPNLIAPIMRQFYALSFSQPDSLVPQFADQATTVSMRRGSRAIFGVGNYFFDMLCCNYRLGIFYDFTIRGEPSICPLACAGSSSNFITPSFCGFNEYAHRLGFNATYKFECGEINFGGNFVIAGKNTIKCNDIFASFIAIF